MQALLELTPIIPLVPFLGFIFLALGAGRLSNRVVSLIGTVSVGVSALLALAVCGAFIASGEAPWSHPFWSWLEIAYLRLTSHFT